jgi:multiple sugar transport system substrate-binding protein
MFRICLILGVSSVTIDCGPRSEPKPGSGALAEKAALVVACPDDTTATVIRRYSLGWASEAGVSVQVALYDPQVGPDNNPTADAWVIPPARLAHWAAPGLLHEVPAAYTIGSTPYWGRLLPLYKHRLLIWDRKAYAMPLLGDVRVCFYRRDLFEDDCHRQAFKAQFGHPLTAPETWEEYAQVAEYFQGKPRSGLDHPCASLPPIPVNDDDLDDEFYALVSPLARPAQREAGRAPALADSEFSFHYDLETATPRLASPGFVRGLELLCRLKRFRPATPSADPPAAFARGEAVLCLASPAWISRFQAEPALQSKFAFCPVPGSRRRFDYRTGNEVPTPGVNRVPYVGAKGWIGVVPKSCTRPDLAFALLAALSEPKTSLELVIEPAWGGGAFRREHLENRTAWRSFGLDAKLTETLADIVSQAVWHTDVTNPVVRLRIPDEREHQQALLVEIRSALFQGKAPQQALADATKRWQALDSKKDLSLRKAEYRLSLGLSRNE